MLYQIKLHESARALREDTSLLEEDFNLVASSQTHSALVCVLDETLEAEALPEANQCKQAILSTTEMISFSLQAQTIS